ncbi:MAG: AlpA family phage regulatory protein [Rhizobacter sp.]
MSTSSDQLPTSHVHQLHAALPVKQQADTNRRRLLLRLSEVMRRTGLGKSSIYAGAKSGTFPSPVQIGGRAVAWHEHEIDAWIDARPVVVTGVAR